MDSPIDLLLNSKLLRQVRFGGFLGKLVLFGCVVVVALAFVGYHTGLGALCMYSILAVVLIMMIPAVVFAFKHPQLATLEGAEIITLHQIQQVASKQSISADEANAAPVLEGIKPNKSLDARSQLL
jgi:hypothetical protein